MSERAHNNPNSDANDYPGFLLVGDVGGTNARFSVFERGVASVAEPPVAAISLPTAEFSDTEALVREAHRALVRAAHEALARENISAAAIAIAGPVQQGAGQLTNGVLDFSEPLLGDWLGCPVRLVNDFYAVAASIHDDTPVLNVGTSLAARADVRAVIGPGTGLGMGYLVPPEVARADWQVVASEGGNADFAPVDALELELLAILQRSFTPVSIETLVSGRGLPNLYTALCELWGAPAEHTTAAAISDAALAFDAGGGDSLSHKTLELFCAMLGTAAGNFALSVGARGGVYLAGGILPRMQAFFLASDFRRRFEDRGALAEFNQQIPTFLVLDPEPGLSGALTLARRLLD